MIGGGFGGSVLALLPVEAGPAVRAAVADAFLQHWWAPPSSSTWSRPAAPAG
jgi:galactokinase